jgi:predicted HTH transcriptional regulator
MNARDIRELIEEGEGAELEFKRKISSPEKIARTLSAFANTRGGTILFGVDDDGSIVGIESEKTELEMIELAGVHFCQPPIRAHIEIIPVNRLDVIAASVEESSDKPHSVQGGEIDEDRVFIRVNDKTVPASREVIKVLRDERIDCGPLTIMIGENEKRLFAYLEGNERITVKEYAHLINVSERRASRILTTLVRAGTIRIHTLEKSDYFTLS